eukprot:11388057-Alexandrium_andersonii.AAC.1
MQATSCSRGWGRKLLEPRVQDVLPLGLIEIRSTAMPPPPVPLLTDGQLDAASGLPGATAHSDA